MTPREKIAKFKEELLKKKEEERRQRYQENLRKQRLKRTLKRLAKEQQESEPDFKHKTYIEYRERKTLYQRAEHYRVSPKYEDYNLQNGYSSIQELIEAMQQPNETGRINIEAFIKAIEEVRKLNGL